MFCKFKFYNLICYALQLLFRPGIFKLEKKLERKIKYKCKCIKIKIIEIKENYVKKKIYSWLLYFSMEVPRASMIIFWRWFFLHLKDRVRNCSQIKQEIIKVKAQTSEECMKLGMKRNQESQSQCWVDLALDGSTCYTDRDGLLVKVIVWQDCEVLLESR